MSTGTYYGQADAAAELRSATEVRAAGRAVAAKVAEIRAENERCGRPDAHRAAALVWVGSELRRALEAGGRPSRSQVRALLEVIDAAAGEPARVTNR